MDFDKIIILADTVLAKFVKSQVYNRIGLNRVDLKVLLYIHSLGGDVKNRLLLRKCRNFRNLENELIKVDFVVNKLIYCGYVVKTGGDVQITDKGLILCAKFSEYARDYFSSEGGFNYYYTEDNH
jgi:hypothetical protein